MTRFFLFLACILMFAPWAQAAPAQGQDYEAQMKKAQEVMNSPEYKQHMQKAMERMKQQGIDPKSLPPVNAKMMEAAMGMQRCMHEKLGQGGMDRMAKQGKAMHDKVKSLCAAGKKGEAETATKDYAKTMMDSKEYQVVKACAEQYKEQMNDPSMAAMKKQVEDIATDPKKKPAVCG